MCRCAYCVHSRTVLSKCLVIYEHYEKLLNSFVLDFYVENCWEHLPKSWQDYLKNVSAATLSRLLDYNSPLMDANCPLAIVSLRVLLRNLNLSRQKCPEVNFSDSHHYVCFTNTPQKDRVEKDDSENILFNTSLQNSLWRGVKPKKRHEISVMAKVCYNAAVQANCNFILDFGSGLGHFIRVLTFQYGLKVCGLEAQPQLCEQAKYLDNCFYKTASKHLSPDQLKNFTMPVHLNEHITNEQSFDDILHKVEAALGTPENFSIGIIGLHPCGDLGLFLLKCFQNSNKVRYVITASCCYMKVTTKQCNPTHYNFPLSDFLIRRNCDLGYYSREMSCHAIEAYIDKLESGQYSDLKVHAFRAALEKIIVERDPSKKHMSLRSVKHNRNLSFEEYCRKTLQDIGIQLSTAQVAAAQSDLAKWFQVVVYYSLRLLFAPMIETVMLLDRYLFLAEKGHRAALMPVFDPKMSPRNIILVGLKRVSK